LIGGLALAAHQVVRAKRDIDFLADAEDAGRLHEILLAWVIAAPTEARTRPTTCVTTKGWICCTRIGLLQGGCWRRPLSARPSWVYRA
jgi:hypothetical protein